MVGARSMTNLETQGLRTQGLPSLHGEDVRPPHDVLAEPLGFEETGRHPADVVSGPEIRCDAGLDSRPPPGPRMPHPEPVARGRKTGGTREPHADRVFRPVRRTAPSSATGRPGGPSVGRGMVRTS